MTFSQIEKDKFIEFADSLKKYRRAELNDEQGKDLIDILYTDLLPNDLILKQTLKTNTTFLIGRKGTGKSTIFLKLQKEIRKNPNIISCYVDTKTVFESSKAKDVNIDYLNELLPNQVLQKYLLERTFIQSVLFDVKKEIDKRSKSFLDHIKTLFGQDKSDIVKEKLMELQAKIEDNQVLKKIEMPLLQKITSTISKETENISNAGIGSKIGVDDIHISGSIDNQQKIQNEIEKQFSDIFLKVFQVKDLITQIKEILSILEIKSLYILLDDFSEIDDDAMKTFMDVVIAPLNNWSDEFIKFKIAAYPNRVYYGQIDKGKVDILDLDFFNLYSQVNRDEMEQRAIEFTKRLIDKRITHFTEKDASYFFDTKKESIEEYYRLLFQVSMNVPRIMGYVLYYCSESCISFDAPITRSAINSASQRYYEKNLEPFFDTTTFSLKSYDEKISVLQLKDLLKSFTTSLISIKKNIFTNELKGEIYDSTRTNPYVSHFYFSPRYEDFLKTLELNFFITKYNEMSDRDGGKQSIYCLNYGLALKNNLRWGKPEGNEFRKYFISRPFDFNKIIDEFLKTSKVIKCINPQCNKNFPFEQLDFFKVTKMKCPECHFPIKIISISDRIKSKLDRIDKSLLLPDIEFSLLHEINKEGKVRPKDVSEELDCSYQLIMWKAKKLDQNSNLINRQDDENNKRVYTLTEKAKKMYFEETK